MRSALARHGGREHDEAGDGLMVTFDSARSAATCALDIQHELAGERQARVRIGLHAGDVLERNGRPHGATVAGAARVCARASGGQILASEPVRDLAGTLPGVAFTPGGSCPRGSTRRGGSSTSWRWTAPGRSGRAFGAGRSAGGPCRSGSQSRA